MATRTIEDLEKATKKNLVTRVILYIVAGISMALLVNVLFLPILITVAMVDTATTLYTLRRCRKAREKTRRETATPLPPL